MNANVVAWFEIPVTDMERAKKFYDTVIDISISINPMGELVMGWFPGAGEQTGTSGSLVQHKMYQPSDTHGPLLYFSCEDLANELGKVEDAGGEILQPKTAIGGGHGFMALFKDTEGNRLAMHSLK